jgi:hypothetical protein
MCTIEEVFLSSHWAGCEECGQVLHRSIVLCSCCSTRREREISPWRCVNAKRIQKKARVAWCQNEREQIQGTAVGADRDKEEEGEDTTTKGMLALAPPSYCKDGNCQQSVPSDGGVWKWRWKDASWWNGA